MDQDAHNEKNNFISSLVSLTSSVDVVFCTAFIRFRSVHLTQSVSLVEVLYGV